jgi:hypothetical protein
VLLHKQPADPVAAREALNWAYASGGKMAEELHYVPMPAGMIGAVQKLWAGRQAVVRHCEVNARGRPPRFASGAAG